MKRHTLQTFTQKAQALHGDRYTYLSLDFDHKPMKAHALCPEHGEFTINGQDHLKGYGCLKCGNAAKGASKRMAREDFLAKAKEVHGDAYTYGDLFWENQKAKVTITCPEHGEFIQGAAQHLAGQRCKKCAYVLNGAKRKMTLEGFTAKAKTLHGGKYTYGNLHWKGQKAWVRVTCPEHGEFEQAAGNHLKGAGCPECGKIARGLAIRWKYEDVVLKAREVHGDRYEYPKLEIVDKESKLTVACPEHGEFEQTLHEHLAKGSRCKKCANAEAGLARRYTLEQFNEKAHEVHGGIYEYLAYERVDGVAYVTAKCKVHGEFKQRAAGHMFGEGCPRCTTNRISKPNQEIADYITSFGIEVVMEHKIGRKFLDIYVPSQNLAFEYNGNYWHSSQYLPSNAHKEKSELAKQYGIRVIHIFSHEWEQNQEVVKQYIRRACQVQETRVFARKTEVTEVSPELAKEFLNKYHIQGHTPSDYVGLKHNNTLVAVMGFSKRLSARGQNISNTTELTRYATSCNVVGGFSKLLATNTDSIVVSYSDNRMFDGRTYEKNGFTKVGVSQPDYKYLEDNTLKHKANYQKSRLAQRFGVEACQGKTERQITEENGLYRVYDCGKTKWELKR